MEIEPVPDAITLINRWHLLFQLRYNYVGLVVIMIVIVIIVIIFSVQDLTSASPRKGQEPISGSGMMLIQSQVRNETQK